jgi:PAS domain S-box-containing protein
VERALYEGERRAAAVIENSLDAYVSIDSADRIVGWNKKAEEIFGWSADEVRGRLLSETIVPVHLRDRHTAAVRACDIHDGKLLGRRIEMPARTRSDRQLLVELSILAFEQADQPIFVASLRDITKQREQETQLRALNENLEHVVVERTGALEHANTVLRTTNEQLDAFTRNVSHDLRAPLRAIEGYTRLAAEEGESTLTSTSRSHLKAVLRNVRRMQSIIDGLLKLAWIGQQPIHAQDVDLWKLVLDIVNELSAENTFVLRAQPESLQCTRADPLLLEHALRNLLSNAVKFSKRSEEPTVEVGMHEVDGEHRFFVKDNGVGFDPQHSGMLFQVFGRLHRADEFEGTGIGLTIAKNVIERHGGRIWAQSTPGEGATFWFTLPKRAA